MTVLSPTGVVTNPPPMTTYRTELSSDQHTWTAAFDLGLGFVWDPSRSIPEPYVQLGGTDVSEYVALTVDDQRCLVISFDLTSVQPLVCASSPPLYLLARVTLTPDGDALAGSITKTCGGEVKLTWRGTTRDVGATWLTGVLAWTAAKAALIGPRLAETTTETPAPRGGDTMSISLHTVLAAGRFASMSDEDGANLLISMSDLEVRSQVGATFVQQMQTSAAVHSTFFARVAAPSVPALEAPLAQWVGEAASALIALSLRQTSAHGFKDTVKADVAQSFLQGNLAPGNISFLKVAWHNYEALFPAHCKINNTALSSFTSGAQGDPKHWANVLANHLTSPAYINQQFAKLNPSVDPGGWYQILFANIYKVAVLDATQRQRVVDAWDQLLKGKEVPGIVPWTYYDHMVASSYGVSTFMSQVLSAISLSYSKTKTLGCTGGMAAHCTTETTTTYGAGVNDWLGAHRGLGGFIVRPSSGNVETDTSGGGGCCFVQGTPILLADGTTKAIEQVSAGDRVVSRDGAVSERSPQDVIWPIAPHELIFGINELAPFFNASHPFMTKEGWKSMSPEASRRMNPDLEVGQLAEGDVLMQAEGGPPFTYREVRIDRITRALAGDLGQVHSLHLRQDNPGYHAHGFLVAVNYPQLREDHFVRAFQGVTEAEREYLATHFEALAPYLRRGLGPYVSEILRRSLGLGRKSPMGAPLTTEVTHS